MVFTNFGNSPKNRKVDPRGFSLIEVMIAMAIASILALAMAQVIVNQGVQLRQQRIEASRDEIKNRMANLIGDATAILNTEQALSNSVPAERNFKRCIAGTGFGSCNGGGGRSNCCNENAYGSLTAPFSIPFFDNSGNQVSGTVSNPVGYNQNGSKCSPGSSDCTFNVWTTYEADCPGGGGPGWCSSLAEDVTIKFHIEQVTSADPTEQKLLRPILGTVNKTVPISGSSMATTSGSGTENTVPKWDASGNLVLSSITEIAGDVGIGTPNPQRKLHVEGTGLKLSRTGSLHPAFSLQSDAKGGTEHFIFGPYNTSSGMIGALYISAGRSADGTKNDIILYNYNCTSGDCLARTINLMADDTEIASRLSFNRPGGSTVFSGLAGLSKTLAPNDDAFFLPINLGVETTDLRLYVVDNAEDQFSIWGDSCTGDPLNGIPAACGSLDSATQGHAFRADGGAYHKRRLGIGTTVPATGLHIADAGEPAVRLEKLAGTTGTWDMRIESDGSFRIQDRTADGYVENGLLIQQDPNSFLRINTTGGATLQTAAAPTWQDVCLGVSDNNGAGFGHVGRLCSGGGGSSLRVEAQSSGNLEFNLVGSAVGANWTFNNAVGGERMRITGTGDVGIGTSSPTERLHVIGDILASGTITPSDRRLKTDIRRFDNVLERLLDLNAYTYHWKDRESHGDSLQVGLIAQEVEEVLPEVVSTGKDGFKRLSYTSLIAPIIEAIKELFARLLGLDARVETLEREVASKNERIEALEAKSQALEAALCRNFPDDPVCAD